jgi:hypothetical protein
LSVIPLLVVRPDPRGPERRLTGLFRFKPFQAA